MKFISSLAATALAALICIVAAAPFADAQDEVTVPDVIAAGVVNMDATKHPIGELRGRLVLLTFFAP